MKKKYIKRSLIFSFILIIVTISMSIGFAAYNINISITGDVHYDPPEAIYVSNITVNSGTTSMTPTHTTNTVTVGNIYTGSTTYKYNVTFRNHTDVEKKVSAVSGTNSSCTYSLDILNSNIKVDEYKTGVLTISCSVTSNVSSTVTFTFSDFTIHKLVNNSITNGYFLGVTDIANETVKSVKFGDYDTLLDDDDFMATVSAQYNVETSNNSGYGIVAFVSAADSNGLVDVTVGSVDGVVYTGTSTNFHGLTKLESIDFTNLDTTYLTTMNSFLLYANNLTTLDITSLNTSRVGNMYRAFKNLYKITSISMNGIDTSKVQNFAESFMNLGKSASSTISVLDLSNWDVSSGTSMLSMFRNVNVNIIKITNWRPIHVTNMSYMFAESPNLTEIHKGYTGDGAAGAGLPCDSATNMSYMFRASVHLNSIPPIITSNSLTNTSNMFYNTYNIDSYYLYDMNTSSVTDMSYMFFGAGTRVEGGAEIYLNNLSFESCTDMHLMFAYASISSIYVSSSFVPTFTSSFDDTDMFNMIFNLYGGSGTNCTSSAITVRDSSYAKIDGGSSSPGCFTAISN